MAVVLALTGQPDAAETIVGEEAARRPRATLLQGVYVPVARAAIALGRDNPDGAIENLRAAAPYQLGAVAALVPIYLRAEAYRARGDGEAAAVEYQMILDHRGVDPFSSIHPVARLGLARAHALTGDAEASRRAYEELFTLWGDGDADVPVLREARREHAALDG